MRHWRDLEELDPAYEADPKVQEKRGQEFYEKPIEWLERVERLDEQGVARREFLTVMAASMAMSAVSCVRRPVHQIIPHVIQPEEVVPGIPTWYASTCNECPSRCGVLVKTLEGRPIKLEGNPDHPHNRGKLCARGQASLLNLYDPDRLKTPLAHLRAEGGRVQELTLDAADVAIQTELKKVLARGGRVRFVTGAVRSPSLQRLIGEFLSAFPAGRHIEYEPLIEGSLAEAQKLSYGAEEIPGYRFDQAQFVLSVGADFLGTWGNPVESTQDWMEGRRVFRQEARRAKMSQLVCFESHWSITGANADHRHPLPPGKEQVLLLGLIQEWFTQNPSQASFLPPSVHSFLSAFSLSRVAAEVGVSEQTLKKYVRRLQRYAGRSLVVAQGGVEVQLAAQWLNALLQNEGKTLGSFAGTFAGSSSSALKGGLAGIQDCVAELQAGKVDAVFFAGVNPAYTLPHWDWKALLAGVSLVVAIADRDDETAALADYVFPESHFLEAWGDAETRPGLWSIQQPVIEPLFQSRSLGECLLKWSRNGGVQVFGLAAQASDWHLYLQANWAAQKKPWKEGLQKGVAVLPGVENRLLRARSGLRVQDPAWIQAFTRLIDSEKKPSNGFFLSIYAKVSQGDGRSANNAWLQELPDPLSAITWDNYLVMGPEDAAEKGLKSDDVVRLSRVEGTPLSVEVPVRILPGIPRGGVSLALGYGRWKAGKVALGAGVTAYPWMKREGSSLRQTGIPVTLEKTGRVYVLASAQWHTATEQRPILNDLSLEEYRKNPAAAAATEPPLRMSTVPSMWTAHEYPGYRWGMAIDLTACTGCGACVVACQAENNIPVVGRDQVRKSRRMHWIRIDRYFSGSPQDPEVVFQPMLCQHCENAPCETVCPVLATVHDSEGLNVQVYNRCVGTRYCQNNCPYKVRVFNFFDHWKQVQKPHWVLNPEVSVRSRGVMEKCTFCLQRIRSAKEEAKKESRLLREGELQTACQQTCPTQAITFGNVNDAHSEVSRLRAHPGAFRALESLNAKPMISYLTKVRHRKKKKAPGGKAHV